MPENRGNNYVKVKTHFDKNLVNQIKTVKLLDIDRDGIVKIDLIRVSLPLISARKYGFVKFK